MTSISHYPDIIILGFHGKTELDIIKGIMNEPLPPQESSEHLEKYKWLIDNKYYSAEIYLCKIKSSTDYPLSPSIFDSSEAVIFYIDSKKTSALSDIDEVVKSLKYSHLEVKLLVCDDFTSENEESLTRGEAQEWCIGHGWELVELTLETTDSNHEDDLEDDFIDSWGYTRIKQALNAHTWSNLQLKDKEDGGIGYLVKELTLTENRESEVPYEKLETGETKNDFIPDDEHDDFSQLFSSLGAMKETADALPTEERRLYAEKIALAFLRSLGDEEEAGDFDSENEQT